MVGRCFSQSQITHCRVINAMHGVTSTVESLTAYALPKVVVQPVTGPHPVTTAVLHLCLPERPLHPESYDIRVGVKQMTTLCISNTSRAEAVCFTQLVSGLVGANFVRTWKTLIERDVWSCRPSKLCWADARATPKAMFFRLSIPQPTQFDRRMWSRQSLSYIQPSSVSNACHTQLCCKARWDGTQPVCIDSCGWSVSRPSTR